MEAATVDLRPYRHADAEAVVALWNQCMDERFAIDLRLFSQNTRDCPHFREDDAWVVSDGPHVVGYLGCKVAREPLGSLGLLPERGWISALLVHPEEQRCGLGTELIAFARERLGARQVLLGGDPSHFFPGIPVSCEAALAFFRHHGFSLGAGRAYDLRGDLDGYRLPEQAAGWEIVPCAPEMVPELDRFMAETFPGRWRHDVMRRVAREPAPHDVLVALDGSGRVVGFSSTYHPASAVLGPSVYWRQALGPQYGGLGPIGIADAMRGRGLGMALVHRSMDYVRRHGTRHMAIDWTVLLDFYGKAGFKPWNEYVLASREP